MKSTGVEFRFVELMPPDIQQGTLYISTTYATAVHLCACGCGNKVVTPLSPAEWSLIFDGDSVSLSPSIGNWELPCRSHYWIRRNAIQWARPWTRQQIEDGRRRDLCDLENYFAHRSPEIEQAEVGKATGDRSLFGWFRRMVRVG